MPYNYKKHNSLYPLYFPHLHMPPLSMLSFPGIYFPVLSSSHFQMLLLSTMCIPQMVLNCSHLSLQPVYVLPPETYNHEKHNFLSFAGFLAISLLLNYYSLGRYYFLYSSILLVMIPFPMRNNYKKHNFLHLLLPNQS